jgi:hypothetical protein
LPVLDVASFATGTVPSVDALRKKLRQAGNRQTSRLHGSSNNDPAKKTAKQAEKAAIVDLTTQESPLKRVPSSCVERKKAVSDRVANG